MSKKFDDEEWGEIEKEASAILSKFMESMNREADDETVVTIVKEWQEHISKYYYNCDAEVYYGIAMLYISDDDYKNSLERKKQGLAEFLNKAITSYCVKALQ